MGLHLIGVAQTLRLVTKLLLEAREARLPVPPVSTSANTKLSSSAPNVLRSALTLSKERPRTVASRPESEEVQLRCFDDALQGMSEPWLHRRDQEDLLEQPDITLLPRVVAR